MERVAIVGAGISGLSAAHFLKEEYEVTVFEKENVAGGLLKCRRVNGSLFHTCGGHVFNSKKEDVLDWFWNVFSTEDFTKADRNASVFFTSESGNEEVVIPYPIENHMYLFDDTVQKQFVSDMMHIAKAEHESPRNFEEFLRFRFGHTLYKLYFKPYNEKVWRRDLSQVPLSWLEGKLPMPTVEEIIYNNMNHVKEKTFVHSSFWYSKNDGSQYLVDRLSKDIDIKYDNEILSIKNEDGKWIVAGQVFDKVVFCGNIKSLPSLLGTDVEPYRTEIEKLEYHGTTAVFCEIDRNPYSWIYQPSPTHESHRIICTGNFSESNNSKNVPADRITATIEFTDEISKEDILDNLSRIPLNPKYLDHQYNKYTYPIQDPNTRKMILELKEKLMKKGFYFTGRFADWEYYNMDVAVEASMRTCRIIKEG